MSLLYIGLGLFAGLLSGLLGIGGGIFLVPSFVAIFAVLGFHDDILFRCATGTSLATMSFTALFAIISHLKHTRIEWQVVRWLVLGTMLGALLGAWFTDLVPVTMIKIAFGLLCIYVAYRLFDRRILVSKNHSYRFLPLSSYLGIGLVVGMVSSMLGIGGGLILVPLLIWFGMPFPKASASSIACTLPTVFMGAVGACLVGLDVDHIPPNALGFVVWDVALLAGFGSLIGAPLGVKCLQIFPELVVKRLFSLILVIIAWQMLPTLW